SMYASAACLKVTPFACFTAAALAAALLWSMGSMPSPTSSSASFAFLRAVLSDTFLREPSPMSRRQPLIWNLKIHVFAPPLAPCREKAPPSASMPGILCVLTLRLVRPAAFVGTSISLMGKRDRQRQIHWSLRPYPSSHPSLGDGLPRSRAYSGGRKTSILL